MFTLKRNYTFYWEGIASNGTRCTGKLTGNNKKVIIKELHNQDITPLSVRIKSQFSFGIINKKISHKQIVDFTQQLALLLKTGIPLQESLSIILKGQTCITFQKIITKIKLSLESGKSLTHALQQFPKHFDPMYCSLINAGETAGALTDTLADLSHYLERSTQLKTKIRKAMLYPLTVLCTAILITTGLLLYVVPEFKSVFNGFGAKLPWLTRVVISASNTLQHHSLFITSLFIIMTVTIRHALKQAKLRRLWHLALLSIPIVRKTIITSTIARWVRILATTSMAGMPLINALKAAENSINNIAIKEAINSVQHQVSQGQPLHHVLQQTPYFPHQACAMIALGENSGTLDTMLSKIADIYSTRADNLLDGLSKLLEPVIMLVLAIIMGSLIIAMYLPIFKLGSVL